MGATSIERKLYAFRAVMRLVIAASQERSDAVRENDRELEERLDTMSLEEVERFMLEQAGDVACPHCGESLAAEAVPISTLRRTR